MTSHEIIDGLLHHRRVNRVGLTDLPWADTLQRWVQEGYPVDAKGNPVDPAEHFGFDLYAVGGWFNLEPLVDGGVTEEETDEWLVRRNGSGAALKWWKRKSGTPEHIDFRMTSRAVWEREYRSHLLTVDRRRIDFDSARTRFEQARKANAWAHYGHMFIWESMRQSLGDECMYMSLVADPDWIHDYNRVYTDFYKAHYTALIEEVGRPDGVWIYEDLGYRNGLFCSPAVLEELIFPYYKEVVDFFHEQGMPVVLHSCGGVTDALPLVVQAGFDGLNPMEAKAGCNLLRFAEQYGDRLVFFGGYDATLLESGDRDLIRRSVTDLVEGMKARGARYVFGSDHSISTRVSYADFCYAIEVYRDHMAY